MIKTRLKFPLNIAIKISFLIRFSVDIVMQATVESKERMIVFTINVQLQTRKNVFSVLKMRT